MNVDAEFRNLIPALRPEELRDLEASVMAEGCRDALVTWQDTLLDGHNRYDICERHGIGYRTIPIELPDRAAAKLWIMRNQLARRNLTDAARVALVRACEPEIRAAARERQIRRAADSVPAILPEQKADSRDLLGEIAGVSGKTYEAAAYVLDNGELGIKKQMMSGEMSINAAVKKTKANRKKKKREKERAKAAAPIKAIHDSIIHGDFREVADRIPDGSVSLILTDPPYNKKASKLLPAFALFAAAKLCDGGSLLCYVGGTQMLSALDAFRGTLHYWWTIACVYSGRAMVMREYGVKVRWKAILWFVKGSRLDDTVIIDDVVSGGEEKAHHEWQQAESEAKYLIEKLCPKGGIVLDPFLGSGTTAVAAKKLKRKWIGIEIDEKMAKIASARLMI